MDLNILFGVFVFIMGAIIGSFLNVCIVRLPLEKSIVRPGSHCVACKAPIAWYDNIPLISWLVLGGRCRACKAKISFRYWLVELLTGSVFFLFWRYYGMHAVLWPYLVMMSGFIVATFVDFEHRIIPDEVSIGGIVAGLAFSLVVPQLQGATSPLWGFCLSLLGVLAGGGVIYLMGMIGDFVFKKETMGGGDVKLMGMVGAFMGWKLALLTFFLAPFFGAVYGIIEKIRTKDSAIAYGPFLILGALTSLFWGERIIHYVITGGVYHL
ncbi:MAG: prepilin peptidase [Candidatus Omnitrophica bacterium]|nr:prepilin peptidase [Candidatus Omnitrophota bacterium]MDE2009110.1 prepilin peptidase [Candidatus Omnitrophota bacterium]MDE2214225.1 prepilin peptidase [Candidatus Omnitrophota bacterium]MDE2231262.1 prepilin peptidase [Candidatus Omnitrophota bacterium]